MLWTHRGTRQVNSSAIDLVARRRQVVKLRHSAAVLAVELDPLQAFLTVAVFCFTL